MTNSIAHGLALLMLALSLQGCGGKAELNPSGSLEATEIDIVSTIPARIASVRAELGSRVSAGDTLVVLDTELLTLQRTQTEAARKTLHAQRDVLDGQVQQAGSSFRLAKLSLDRMQALLDQGSATQQQFDEAQTKHDLAATQLSVLRYQIDVLYAEEGKLDAALAVFDRQISEGVLLSPINGAVILRSTEPGEMASPGAAILRVADLSEMDLRVFLSEMEVGRVKVGQELPVLIDALPGETLVGTVAWISPEAEFTPKNAQTRDARTQLVYAAKLKVRNLDNRLHIGMPAEVKLPS